MSSPHSSTFVIATPNLLILSQEPPLCYVSEIYIRHWNKWRIHNENALAFLTAYIFHISYKVQRKYFTPFPSRRWIVFVLFLFFILEGVNLLDFTAKWNYYGHLIWHVAQAHALVLPKVRCYSPDVKLWTTELSAVPELQAICWVLPINSQNNSIFFPIDFQKYRMLAKHQWRR